MSLIAWVATKGAHGASTGALAVAATWPSPRKVLFVELDPAGGELAARFGLAPERGLVSAAAAVRGALSPADIRDHAQTLPGGVSVLAGPASPQQAHALGRLWTELGPALASLPATDVIADCGRLEPGSPAAHVARHADLVVLVARPTLAGVAHLRARLAPQVAHAPVGVVLVGERPYSAAEIRAAVGVDVWGVLAHDPAGAALLNGEPGGVAALKRAALVRSARSLASVLSMLVARQRHGTEGDTGRSTANADPSCGVRSGAQR